MLDAIVREAAERWGDASCLVAPGGWSVSYRELDEISDEVAAGLADAGWARVTWWPCAWQPVRITWWRTPPAPSWEPSPPG